MAKWAFLRAGIISVAILNTAPLISSPPQPHRQPLSREGPSCPSTLPSQSHPGSGIGQQNHLHTHKEQLFALRESSPCLGTLPGWNPGLEWPAETTASALSPLTPARREMRNPPWGPCGSPPRPLATDDCLSFEGPVPAGGSSQSYLV